jgi:exo-beta-1,3-glucanase (GH17 family)
LADFKMMDGYSIVRIYGVDCNQVSSAIAAAKSTGKKLIVGIYDITQIGSAVSTISSAAGDDWSTISLITVGNEELNKGASSVSGVVQAVNNVRSSLRAAGYQGPVSTVDTFDQVIANKALCDASDITTVNCHAYFTSSVTADQAGQYVLDQVANVRKVCGDGKKVLVTESGWPKSGDSNGAAVASVANQQAAISSLKDKFGNANIILFSAFDDGWKQDYAGTFNAEKHWGILG